MKISIATEKMSDGSYSANLVFENEGVKVTQEITSDHKSAYQARHTAENLLRELVRESHTERNLNPNS